ncbi:MAG TPA: hypothetical protein VIH90_04985 [Candidatus Saccharimonadales bacterium]
MTVSHRILEAIEAAPIMFHASNPSEMRSQDGFGDSVNQSPAPVDAATLVVASPENFKEMLLAINAQLGGERPEADIDEEVRHESAHAWAAARVGATATSYGVQFFRVVDMSGASEPFVATEPFTRFSFARKMPALVLASVFAYPLVPSRGDIADIQGLGYTGVEEVGQRIYAANTEYDFGLPVPLSWNPLGSLVDLSFSFASSL